MFNNTKALYGARVYPLAPDDRPPQEAPPSASCSWQEFLSSWNRQVRWTLSCQGHLTSHRRTIFGK